MAKDLNKVPLNFEPMVALSTDIRQIHGEAPDEPRGADIWRAYNENLGLHAKSLCISVLNGSQQLGELAIDTLHFVRDQTTSVD
jgi:hypothetical protein